VSTEDSRSPFRSRGFVISSVVVALIALAAIIALVSGVFRGQEKAAAPTPAPATSAAAADEDPSVCGRTGYETTSSLGTTAPSNEWELVGTVAAPTDPATGPGTVDSNGFRSCYSHTAAGALFAAINYVALASDGRNISRLPELIAPGAGRDAALSAAGAEASSSTARVQVAGFKVNSYNPDETTVDVAWSVTSSSGALVSMPVVLRWVDGDWKIALDDAGQPPFSASPLQNLGGYTPWSGV
jgi:hypothetical protein